MNAQNKKQIIIAGVLAAVLIGILFYQFVIAGGPKPPPANPAAKNPAAAAKPASAGGAVAPAKSVNSAKAPGSAESLATGAATSLDALGMDIDALLDQLLKDVQVVSFDYQAQGDQRNPMTPLVGYIQTDKPGAGEAPGAVVPFPLLQKKVSAILWDEHNPVAVVDNVVVSPGYVYPDGVQLQSIERNRVIFKINDALFPIELKEQ